MSRAGQVHERASRPTTVLLAILALEHASIADTPRMVNDGVDLDLAGVVYKAGRFGMRLVDESGGRAPTAQIFVANVGGRLLDWIRDTRGGRGGTATIGEVLAGENVPEWTLTLDLGDLQVGSRTVRWRLGFEPLLSRPSVVPRYDPRTAPGLFG